jgi:hypothetical protein
MAKSRPQQALAVVATMLLVATAVGGGVAPTPVETASAQASDNPKCSTWDSLIYDAISFGGFSLSNEETNPCSAEYQRQQLADEWNETDAKETRTQIHSQAGQLAAGNEQYLTVAQNYGQDSNTIAFSKGEAAAVEVLANGGTIAEAQQAANESINDYYTVKERNLIDRWNVALETAWTLQTRAKNTTGVEDTFVTLAGPDSTSPTNTLDLTFVTRNWTGISTKSQSLLNGSTIQILGVDHKSTPDGGGLTDTKETQTFHGGYLELRDGSSGVTLSATHVKVKPTANLSSTAALDVRDFNETWSSIQQRNEDTKKEVSVYVNDSLGPAVESGDLDAQSYVSPATLAQEYATDYNGSEGYVRAMAIAASSGMSTPDLESTASMTITHDGTTVDGMLLSQNGPQNDTWESGASYDPALISGMQFFAVEGENGTVIELDGSFTIESIDGMDGEEIQTATTQQIVYKTSNASGNYSELQQQIRELQAEIELQKERATAPPGGGGGDGGGPSLPSWLSWLPGGWGGALAGLAAGGSVLALGGLVIGAVLLGIVVRVAL